MSKENRYIPRFRSRAPINKVQIPDDVICRVQSLLQGYLKIPLCTLPTLYKHKYGTHLDPTDYDFAGGLLQMFSSLSNIVRLEPTEYGYVCMPYNTGPRTLKQLQLTTNGVQLPPSKRIFTHRIFGKLSIINADQVLWATKLFSHFKRMYNKGQILLVKSPYELQLDRYQGASSKFRAMTKILQKFKQGVVVSSLTRYEEFKTPLLNSACIADSVEKFPEIFYKVLPSEEMISQESPEDTFWEPLVFDGTTRTVEDLNSYDLSKYKLKPAHVIHYAIQSGIYQKSILMIMTAGDGGLKLGVWSQSMDNNFFLGKDQLEEFDDDLARCEKAFEKISKIDPLTLFQVFASYGLVQILSNPTCKNDLRLHSPETGIDWIAFYNKVRREIGYVKDIEESS